jgi:hypothetical protein
MKTSNTRRTISFKQWLRGSYIVFATVAACMMFGTASLKADCGIPAKDLLGSAFRPAAFVTAQPANPASPQNQQGQQGKPSVVGFWRALLLINGNAATPLFQSIVQFHSDGLEMENADIPTIGGNVCMGVWKQHGNTVQIYHVALIFDSGTGLPPTATGVSRYSIITQTNTLDDDGNSYHGTFTATNYDSDGTNLGSVSGTTEGHRIDFNHHFHLY